MGGYLLAVWRETELQQPLIVKSSGEARFIIQSSLLIAWLSSDFKLSTSWVALYSVVCEWVSEWVCQASVTPDQISTFSNIHRHTSPLLTMYHLIPSSTNLYWPNTSQYRHILTKYHQVQIIIHRIVRPSSANWKISLFTTHLMSHAQYTWSSLH